MTNQSNSNLQLGMTFMVSIFFVFGFITNFNSTIKDMLQPAFDLRNLCNSYITFLALKGSKII